MNSEHSGRAAKLTLNLNPIPGGIYASAWRSGVRPAEDFVHIRHYAELARIAERGKFDAFFMADTADFAVNSEYRTYRPIDPTVLLAYLAAVTERIGLIATVSSSYNTPYNHARRIMSLDHVSGGRAGWNIVVTAGDSMARNFSQDEALTKPERYARAEEFLQVTRELWRSWDDDALLADADTGRYVDVSKVRPINFKGAHFRVDGPLVIHRSPQGEPVILQAGGSPEGGELAAKYAHGVYTSQPTFEGALAYRQWLRERAAHYGRSPDVIKLLPGLITLIGSTEEEVQRRSNELLDLIPLEVALNNVVSRIPLSRDVLEEYLDKEAPWHLIPESEFESRGHGGALLRAGRSQRMTVRDLARVIASVEVHCSGKGTPEQVADKIEHWFRAGAVDGFNVMPAELPRGASDFVDQVVPLLQRRGLFRTEYEHDTLRGHLGLARHD